ncbi:MAG: hypothetical protein IPP12_17865 [Nitrospira sp.]|nr:hypothetical protein [Nitrospira sp.]
MCRRTPKTRPDVPVTVTKPLWEIGIAPSESISDEEKAQRLRDVLMAFRLRIAPERRYRR